VNRLGGHARDRAPIRLDVAKVHVPLSTVIAAWAGRRLWAGVVWVVKRPLLIVSTALLVLVCRFIAAHGPGPLLAALGVVASTLGGWWWVARASFTRHVTWPTRGAWRRTRIYRYRWQPGTVTAALDVRVDGVEYLPRLGRVTSTGSVDVVRVRMLPGHTLEDWASAAPRLAQTFGALECRVRSVPGSVHELVLWFLTTDPLTAPVPAFPAAAAVDLAAVPVALAEDGTVFTLRVAHTHVLVGGETGSGKGSVLWSILSGLGPGIRDGLVQVWAVDPKGGMELAFGAPLFARFAYGDSAADGSGKGTVPWQWQIAALLDEAVQVMQARASACRGVTRSHTPTVDEPLIVVVVDELASLTSYVTDRVIKAQLLASLSLLLSQGRAVGVTLIGATQDARKDVLGMRDLFPTRIALRTAEAEQADLILGAGSRNRGAFTDRINPTTPGVGYVNVDGTPEPVRVRFTHITDHDITALVDRYTPGAKRLTVVDDTGATDDADNLASLETDSHVDGDSTWPEAAA
jgi:S-DNA-T family DNA segregation ATPase FtsK/SpoIIIE